MKTTEELKKIKDEYETINTELKELSSEELKEVTGGILPWISAMAIPALRIPDLSEGGKSGNDHVKNDVPDKLV